MGYYQNLKEFLSWELIKNIFNLSWPVVLTYVTSFGIQFMTYLFVGRLGPLELAATTLAYSFTNVFCLAIIIGLSSALETFCSQAFGAKQFKEVGVVIQRALWIFGFAGLVIWAICLHAERLMIALYQDPAITRLAAGMIDVLSCGIPTRFLLITTQKYLQSQMIVKPVLVVGLIMNLEHAALNYIALFVLDWGVRGAALCIIISETTSFALLIFYIKWKNIHKETWPGWSQKCFLRWGPFTKIALGGVGMISMEWAAFEVGAFLIGTISKEELGAFAVTMQMAGMLSMIAIGLSLSSSIFVGQSLGSGDPAKAMHYCKLCMLISFSFALLEVSSLFAVKDYIGYAFIDDREIVQLSAKAVPVFVLFHLFDALQIVAGGVLRGCGLQVIGIWIIFVDYNIVAIPLAVVFSIVLKMNNVGFWLGLSCGIILQVFLFLLLLWKSNWQKLSDTARQRSGVNEMVDIAAPTDSSVDGEWSTCVAANGQLSSKQSVTFKNREESSLSHEESEDVDMPSDEGCYEPDIQIVQLVTDNDDSILVTPRLKFKRYLTMLIAVFIFCVGVVLRLTLPPIEYFEEPFANTSSIVGNVTNQYYAQFIL